ncbi:hypothetical protein ACUTAH_21695 [Metapseudomonas furukawaii]|uniref:hypothetical protein n=1 Tax=Metapseudomonas furukawaii TaxID=1149133 RepID=UPI00404560D0
MGELVYFTGKADLTAKQNLIGFNSHAAGNCPFSNIIWTDNSWDISTFAIGRNQGRTKKIAHFKSLRDDSGSKSAVAIPFDMPFLEFAKSAFSEIMRRFKLQEYRRFLYALQAIEQSLLDAELEPCVTRVNANILDGASDILRTRFKDAWSVGRCLERIVTDIIIPARLVNHNLSWKSSIPYQKPARGDRLDPTMQEENTSKLPHIQSILNLAKIHHESESLPDNIVTGFVSLAMFAPSRVSEILTLPVNCITSAQGDEGEMMGISWRPAKGGSPMTKFSTSDASEEIAKEAVKFFTELGASARIAAKWYAENPGQLYLPPGFEHLRGQPLTLREASLILGRKTPIQSGHARRVGLEPLGQKTHAPERVDELSGARGTSLFSWDSLEQSVLAKLPATFPILDGASGLMWHEALFLIPVHALRPNVEAYMNVPSTITTNMLNNQLGANPGGLTVFSRNGMTHKDGSPIAITTHQFRHLLNTLAQSKHLSESLIAFWSGRKHVTQNDWYDHLPQEAFIEAYTKLGDNGPELSVQGPIADKARAMAENNGLTHSQALKIELGAIHSTRYGICRHDYALTPCPKDKDCTMCGEHAVVKGEARHLAEARYQTEIHEKALLMAQKALENGEPGASRWIKHNEGRLQRWRLVLELLTDPETPDGTFITLPPPEHSQSKTGLAQAVRIVNAVAPDEDESADDLNTLLELEFF